MDEVPVAESVDGAHLARLTEYYEDSWFDYRFLWLDPRTRAMHFGWDLGGGRSHRDSLLAMNAELADRVRLQRGERVLDAGCGVGGTALWLTERMACRVVGVNLVADHVDRARRYTRERGLLDGPRFEVRDFCDTGADGESFDVVWATESICHSATKDRFLREAFRVLRTGGRLVIAEYLTVPGAEPSAEHNGDVARQPDIAAWEAGWEMHLETADRWRSMIDEAGFRGLAIDDVTPHVRSSLRRLHRLCSALGPVATVLSAVGIRSAAQQRNIAGSNAMWRALNAEAWHYAIMVAHKPDA